MDNRTIEETRKNETELIKILDYQTDKLDQYKNNWEELKEWLNEDEYFNGRKLRKDYITVSVIDILNKMKELEEKNND